MSFNLKNNYWDSKNVLVTGCFGFLASSLISKLVKKGAKVVGLTQDYIHESLLSFERFDKKMCITYASVTDYSSMERIFTEYEIQICFHLAAQAIVGVANRSPLTTFETNIKGTWAVLEAAKRAQTLEGIVIASSDKAYGEQKQLPYIENQQLAGRYTYDASKVCAEVLTQSYFHTYDLPVAITRCANLYGPGDLHWSRIIPGTIRSVLLNKQPIIRSDGTPVRDYLYVQDAVDAYLILAENIVRKELKGEAFNFTGESPTNVLDLVNLIILLSGKKNLRPKILGKEKLYGEIDKQYLSCEKAKKILGWKAKYSLKEGLKKTIEWYKNYLQLS